MEPAQVHGHPRHVRHHDLVPLARRPGQSTCPAKSSARHHDTAAASASTSTAASVRHPRRPARGPLESRLPPNTQSTRPPRTRNDRSAGGPTHARSATRGTVDLPQRCSQRMFGGHGGWCWRRQPARRRSRNGWPRISSVEAVSPPHPAASSRTCGRIPMH